MALGISAYFPDEKAVLVIKASARVIAAAKSKKRIKFYFAPVTIDYHEHYCLLSAYLDNLQSPLLIYTPLYDEDASRNIIRFLSCQQATVYMIDEKNRPWLTYRSVNTDFKKFKSFSQKINLIPSIDPLRTYPSVLQQAESWFRKSGVREDRRSFDLLFKEPVTPPDLTILDMTEHAFSFNGSSVRHAELNYSEPGPRQEPDIAEQLVKIFPGENIYLNPLKLPNMEELCDILVTGEFANYYFQLKSSPNTEDVQNRTIERSRAKAIQHLNKAISQTADSLDYTQDGEDFEISIKNNRKFRALIQQAGRNMVFIIIAQELFNDDLAIYADLVLKFAEQKKRVVNFLSESTFYSYMHNCSTEEDFFKINICDFINIMESKEFLKPHPVGPRLEKIRRADFGEFFKTK